MSNAPDKKDRLLSALEHGVAMIHADARRPGVSIPGHLGNQFHLKLNLSYRFDPPDLEVSDWGIRSTLSFTGVRFRVAVPWSAIFAVSSHAAHGIWAFPDDIPPEVLAGSASPPPVEPVRPFRHLPTFAGGASPAPAEPDKAVRQRPHLQLVRAHEDDEG